jgi:hypothetical protein
MSFTGATTFYTIPYGKDGDTIEEPDNELQAQMIDWLLQSATGVADNGVIQEGSYSQAPDTGAGSLVLLNPSGGVSIKASFKSALARSSSSVVWEGMSTGTFYYLYLQWDTSLFTDPSSFTTVIATTPYATDNKNYLLLATYDLTSGYPGVIDSNPDGKRYASGVLDHIATRVDPHSANLTQTNLTVTGSCWVGLNSSNTLRVEQPSIGSSTPLMTLVHANATAPLLYTEDEFIIQDTRITTQLSDISHNTIDNGASSIIGGINTNTTNITTNTGDIATNAGDISTNAGNISTNTGNIATNTGNIATNTGNIGTNTTNISDNTSDIAINTGDISTNAGNIATNTADIATNTADIVTNTGNISTNTTHRNTFTGNPHNVQASETPYDNSGTLLAASNTQDAITELALWLESCCGYPFSSSSSSSSSS